MEDTVSVRPSVSYEVQKIIGVSIGNGNMKNYQVQWAPTWVSGFHLVGCEHLIEEFVQHQSQKNQLVGDIITTTGVDTHEQASLGVNNKHCLGNQESNSCLYSNTLKDIKYMETNDETCTLSDLNGSNQTNTILECVKVEVVDDNEYNEDNDYVNAVEEDDGALLGVQHGKPLLVNSDNGLQNKSFEVEREEIILESEFETDQTSLSNDYENSGPLVEHVSSYAGDNVHICIECNRTFATKRKLSSHLRCHMKPYTCMECHKAFSRKHHLEHHLRVHTGERPFVCTECNKALASKFSLTQHLKIHHKVI